MTPRLLRRGWGRALRPRPQPRPPGLRRRSGRRRARASSSMPSRRMGRRRSVAVVVKRDRDRGPILSTGGPSEPYKPKTSRKWWWIGGAAALAVILVAGLVTAFATNVFTPSHPTPALSGLTGGAGPHGARQGPYDLEGGRTGDVDHRGGRGRGVAEPERGGVAEAGLDGHCGALFREAQRHRAVVVRYDLRAGRASPCNRRTSNPSARPRAPTAIPCRRPSWCCGRSARRRTRRRRPTGPPSRSSRHWATRRSTCRPSRPATRSPRPRPRSRPSA